MKKILLFSIITIFIFSCNRKESADAYGNFFANDIIISAENQGKIIKSFVEQGQKVKKGDTLAIIDNKMLELQKEQILANKKAISSKFSNVIAQVKVLEQRKSVLEKDRQRYENLLKDSAISQQKYDNIVGQIEILDQQIEATKSTNSSIFSELEAIDAKINILNEQIARSVITSPIDGVILEKYLQQNELCVVGKPVFKIANLDTMELTIYISEDMLSSIKLGEKVDVRIDSTNKKMKHFTGTIKWISSEAEFTPKFIQTKKERVNFVYAVKIDVPNDGSIKIGMPADVYFNHKI